MVINTSQWPTRIEPIIKRQFALGFEGLPQEQKMFWDVQDSSKEAETLLSIGDSGVMGEFSGSLDYDEVKENYSKRVIAVEYARAMAIQKRLILTDQIRIIKKLPELLGQSAKRRFLADTYSFLNHAFDTTLTGGDGLALCSTAHTSNVGGNTQGNYGVLELSAPSVQAVRVLMAKFNTNRDNVQFQTLPDTIICSIDQEDYAEEIVKSKGKVDSDYNNINFHQGKYNVIASRLITSTRNWWMANMKMMKQNQMWFNVQKLEMEKDRDFNTKVARWSVYTYYGFGFERWEHIYGNAPV